MFSHDGRATIDRAALKGKAKNIIATIKRLQALSNSLHHAAVCPARSCFEYPTFQRLLRAVRAGKLAAPTARL